MPPIRLMAALMAAATLTACASAPDQPIGPPDYSPVVGNAVPPQGRLIADCVAQAATLGRYVRVQDPDTQMLLFTCDGAPAAAFYAGLAAWSAANGSEAVVDGRTIRSTARVRQDLFGVDHCVSEQSGVVRCFVNLNVGEFLSD